MERQSKDKKCCETTDLALCDNGHIVPRNCATGPDLNLEGGGHPKPLGPSLSHCPNPECGLRLETTCFCHHCGYHNCMYRGCGAYVPNSRQYCKFHAEHSKLCKQHIVPRH